MFLALLGLCFADEIEQVYKNAQIKPVSSKTASKKVVSSSLADLKTSESKKSELKQTPAQDRQDTYGSPAAPSVDTYGSPQAAPDAYGAPSADPVAPVAPVQGEVGTQGYYYYYYPVANSYPSSTSHNSKVSSSSSSSGGLLGGGLGLILVIGLGVAVLAVLAISFGNSGRRSLSNSLLNVDLDDMAYTVFKGIELWNEISA